MKRGAEHLPTHRWLLKDRLMDKLAWIFIALIIVVTMSVVAITYSLKRDCTNVDVRDYELGGYWYHTEMGKIGEGCPAPYHET